MAGKGPTPDFDQVTLKWSGVDLDGTPTAGRLELSYNGGVMLDDDATLPVSIYPTLLVTTIATTTDMVGGVAKTVGYAEFAVPATDDPDIQGSGGTYTLVERLTNGKGQTRTFVASKDAPGGVIWLNRITSVTPVVGQAVSAVSVADFVALQQQVALGSGGQVTIEVVQDIVGAMMRGGGVYDDDAGTFTLPVGGGAAINDAAASLGTAYSSSKTVAVVQAAIANLVGGAPAALDTLSELAAGLTSDQSAVTALLAAVALRVRVDAVQLLTAAQQAQGRSNLGIGFTVKGQVVAMPTTQAQFDATGAAIGEYFEVTG